MATNPHLFLVEADNDETFILSSQTFFMGIPEDVEGKQYTSIVMSNGMAVRIPGTPEHVYGVLKRQHNYRKQDWPDDHRRLIQTNLG